jgi:hypothetical protein
MTAAVTPQKASLSEVKRKLLEKYARGERANGPTFSPAIDQRPAGEPIPLSRFQEEIWLDAKDGEKVGSFYNESTTIHRFGDLNREAMECAFTEIIKRHEAWRSTFDTVDGRPIQVIRPAPSRVPIPHVDLRTVPESSRWVEAVRIATEDTLPPFDLREGPLVRAILITLDEQRHSLFVTMHQSITDGVSVYQILPSELSTLYSRYSGGDHQDLPDLPLQFADLAYWERSKTQQAMLDDDLAFWRRQLMGNIPQLGWPCGNTRIADRSRRGAIQAFTVPEDLCDALVSTSKREGVTLFMTLLAGFIVLLHDYTRQEDIVTGTVAPAGRKRSEAGPLLGYFLNPVALRVDVSGDPTVGEVLHRCRQVTFEALSHDNLPLGYLRRHLWAQPSPTGMWPFNTAITLAPPSPILPEGWSQTSMDCDGGWAKWDLYLEFAQRAGGLIGRIQYQTDLFTPVIISRLIEDLEKVLGQITLDSSQRISGLRHISSKRL